LAPDASGTGRLPAAYLTTGSSSFSEFLGHVAPDQLPGRRTPPLTAVTTQVPHGTTIVAVTFAGGVVMAGDRRATMGNLIAQRDIEKVFHGDDFSAVGIAGTAGWRSSWCACSRSSWSTTRRSRARPSRSTARPTGWR
jgi:proteasome beta subunit